MIRLPHNGLGYLSDVLLTFSLNDLTKGKDASSHVALAMTSTLVTMENRKSLVREGHEIGGREGPSSFLAPG